MRSMVVGADTGAAPEACPLHRSAVPLPRYAGEDRPARLYRLAQARSVLKVGRYWPPGKPVGTSNGAV